MFWWQPNLNKLLALGKPAWKDARATLQRLLSCMFLFHFSQNVIVGGRIQSEHL